MILVIKRNGLMMHRDASYMQPWDLLATYLHLPRTPYRSAPECATASTGSVLPLRRLRGCRSRQEISAAVGCCSEWKGLRGKAVHSGSRRLARYCVKITGAPRVQTGWAPRSKMCGVSVVEEEGYVGAASESRTNYNGVHRVSAGNKRKREATMKRFGPLSETLGRHGMVGAVHQASRIGAFSDM